MGMQKHVLRPRKMLEVGWSVVESAKLYIKKSPFQK
jgi:hypothetical protein